jgi:hypothetical protein
MFEKDARANVAEVGRRAGPRTVAICKGTFAMLAGCPSIGLIALSPGKVTVAQAEVTLP